MSLRQPAIVCIRLFTIQDRCRAFHHHKSFSLVYFFLDPVLARGLSLKPGAFLGLSWKLIVHLFEDRLARENHRLNQHLSDGCVSEDLLHGCSSCRVTSI